MKLLVTGGLGFMGSDFIRYILDTYPDYEVTNLDKQTYAGNPENVIGYDQNPRYSFVHGDIADVTAVQQAMTIRGEKPDAIINFAAETHVDRSIQNPEAFLQTAVMGTYRLLEAAKNNGVARYIQISTDEVFGEIEEGGFTEQSPINPRSPYSAAKAAGDLLVSSYATTYGLPAIVTHCCNNFGTHHYPEKLIPLTITNLLEGKKVPVYGDGKQVREWIYVRDHSKAVNFILHNGTAGEVYNIGTGNEKENIETVRAILAALQLNEDRIEYIKDRPGHDRRYAIDSSKLRALGWKPEHTFEQGLQETVQWFKSNEAWWKKIKSGEYLAYYEKQYGGTSLMDS
jgi:dTDP-glucose 4,6-dehydratase